jgi:hypothetical protein
MLVLGFCYLSKLAVLLRAPGVADYLDASLPDSVELQSFVKWTTAGGVGRIDQQRLIT